MTLSESHFMMQFGQNNTINVGVKQNSTFMFYIGAILKKVFYYYM